MKTTTTKSDVLQDIQNEINLRKVFDPIKGLMDKYKPLSRSAFDKMKITYLK